MPKQEFYFQWHILERCNLRCKHCYQEGYKSQDLPLDKLLHIANEVTVTLAKWNMLGRVSLTGGEPFLSPHLFDLLTHLEKDENITELGILSNGTCITDEHIEKIKQYKKFREIQISLDGTTAETHNKTRGNGTFEKSVETIYKLRKSDIPVAVMFTLTKTNIGEAVKIIDLAEELEINAITVERVTPCGNSMAGEILTAYEIKETYTAITERANVIKTNLRVRRTRPLWIHTKKLNEDENASIGGFCPVGFTSISILHDGTVLPCRRLNIPIGNLLNEKFFKIWYGSEVLWRIRDKKNLQGKCNSCPNIANCGGCRAIAYETTGNYMGEDIQCWI
jgi:radical SAM protein with 4Fe4S-binding SPASM domain